MVIERLQPYHGGDAPLLLWSLHDLDIARKHRRLLRTYSSPHGFGVVRYAFLPRELDAVLREQPPDKGYVFPRGPANPDYHIQIRIDVSLAHISWGGGEKERQSYSTLTPEVGGLWSGVIPKRGVH